MTVDGENPIRSLAVAPLLNLTGDSTQIYLAQGITDQLVTTLAQIGALRVVGLKGDQAGNSGKELARGPPGRRRSGRLTSACRADSANPGAAQLGGDRSDPVGAQLRWRVAHYFSVFRTK